MPKLIRNQIGQANLESSLSGTPARDYIMQDTPCEEQIRRVWGLWSRLALTAED